MIQQWVILYLGTRCRANLPRPMDTETDPAVWDTESKTRYDDSRTQRRRQDQVHPHPDEVDDGVWRASQGDENESQGYYCTTDVWSSWCSHQRLDWRNFLYFVEENSQNKEGTISNTFLFLFSNKMMVVRAGNLQIACQNSKQGRPWSDCFFRSLTITVYPVCLGLFNMQLVFEIIEHLPYSVYFFPFHRITKICTIEHW